MNIKKFLNANKIQILTWSGLVSAYFFTRLVNLKMMPIFTDEAIYSYWAQIALNDPANRFISLEDGKQPLFIWLAAIFQEFIEDPLIATRLVSVFAGFGSLIGIYLLAKTLFTERVAKVADVLYIILPLTLLYDRLALFDSLLTMFGIYAFYFTVKMVQNPRLDTALLNGFTIGGALITKSSGAFFLYLIPFSLLFFNFKSRENPLKLLKWISLTVVTFLLSQIIFNSLRLSPLFYIINRKNHEFIRTFAEILDNPMIQLPSNINTLITWLTQYIGWPLLILTVAVMIRGLVKKNLPIILLSIYALIPFAIEGIFNKVLYPRFILFYFPSIVILISFALVSLVEFKKSSIKYVWLVLIIIISLPAFNSFKLLTNPSSATIANSDLNQYFNDWPAGYGVREITEILNKQSINQKVIVGTEGTFGLLPFALKIYFFENQNVEIIGFWPVRDIPQQVLNAAKTQKTYFVFNENQNLPDDPGNPHLKLIGKYQKGKGNSFMRLYEVTP